MAADDQQFCLRWNNHQSTLISVFDTLLESGTLVDCTLAAEGQYLKAHKVVLSACSPYLEVLLSQHYEKHPIVILKDVKFQELKSMMDYMYRGEVNISQDQLGTFLKAAESLQIKGLSDNGDNGDARDVGSTAPKKEPPPRKPPVAPPPTPRNINVNMEQRRPTQVPLSPSHGSREDSMSPSLRKRRRTRRNSQGSDIGSDSLLDTTSNSCDIPSLAQSTPIVPSIPATIVPSAQITKPPPLDEQNLQTDTLNRLDNSILPESGLLKAKVEPPSEELITPKTEYIEDVNNDDSVEDLTLDDDDDMDASQLGNMSQPGPSHGGDGSNQGYTPWHLSGNQSGTDEVFMAAQEAVGAHRDSQDRMKKGKMFRSSDIFQLCDVQIDAEIDEDGFYYLPPSSRRSMEYSPYTNSFKCHFCDYSSKHLQYLKDHIKTHTGEKPYKCNECGFATALRCVLHKHKRTHSGARPYKCPECSYSAARGDYLKKHMRRHTGEKPYKCKKCAYSAAQPSTLSSHMKKHHRSRVY